MNSTNKSDSSMQLVLNDSHISSDHSHSISDHSQSRISNHSRTKRNTKAYKCILICESYQKAIDRLKESIGDSI